jgi:hypothetical protein
VCTLWKCRCDNVAQDITLNDSNVMHSNKLVGSYIGYASMLMHLKAHLWFVRYPTDNNKLWLKQHFNFVFETILWYTRIIYTTAVSSWLWTFKFVKLNKMCITDGETIYDYYRKEPYNILPKRCLNTSPSAEWL